jgi:protein O-mannosyl-transferase
MSQRITRPKGTAHALHWRPVVNNRPAEYWLLAVALCLAVVGYAPTLRYGFVFDDVQQIVENPAIRSWSHIWEYFTAHVGAGVFPSVKGSFYRPLFLIWLRLNYILFKVTPWGWHLTSLLAHLAAVWMFFLLVRLWTRDGMVAGWSALLFAVHPIHIEAVAWISAVPEILFALAGMGSMYAYFRFRQVERPVLLGISELLYGIALLAKETAIVIWPVIFVSGRMLDRAAAEKDSADDRIAAARVQSAFAAVSAAYFGLRLLALRGLRGEVTHTALETVCAAPSIAWFYLQKLVLPIRLSEIYYNPEAWSFTSPHFYFPLIGVSTVLVGVLFWISKSKLAVFPALMLGLPLIPPLLGVSVFPRHDLAHDRYLYLPSAGLCMLLALAMRAAIDAAKPTGINISRIGTSIVVLLSFGLVLSVWEQETPYRDNEALFTHSAELFPKSARSWGLLGEEHMTRGRYKEGIASFQRAQSLEPAAVLTNYRLGAAYYLIQDMPSAETYFQHAADAYRNPDTVSYDYLLYRLGLSQYAQGRMPEAESTLRHATDLQPKGFGYHVALGAVLKYEGNLVDAKKQFELELQLGADKEASELLQSVDTELAARRPN